MDAFASSMPELVEELETLTSQAIHTLQAYMCHKEDPVGMLNQYYQKHGFQNGNECFREPKLYRFRRGKAIENYWRLSLFCPLNQDSLGPILAIPLFFPNPPGALVELTQKYFGPYEIHENHVYFKTKKNARRSVALAKLIQLFGKDGLPDDAIAPKKKTQAKPNAPVISQRTLEKLRQNPIWWVDKLHDAGIRHIQMTYREPPPTRHLGRPQRTWTCGKPTLVQCEIEAKTVDNETLQVLGEAVPSKKKARKRAIYQLLDQRKEKGSKGEKVSQDKEPDSVLVEKYLLKQSDTALVSYSFAPPEWALHAFSWKTDGCFDPTSLPSTLLLYEVVIRSAATSELPACQKLYLSPDQATRFGVVLPPCEELLEDLPSGRCAASFRFAEEGEEYVVTLEHRQEIQVSTTEEPWDLLPSFNSLCGHWKIFGLHSNEIVIEEYEKKTHSRRYMFVPLLAQDDTNELAVDWHMVEAIVNDKKRPYMKASRREDIPFLSAGGAVLACVALSTIPKYYPMARASSFMALAAIEQYLEQPIYFVVLFLAVYVLQSLVFPTFDIATAQVTSNTLLCYQPHDLYQYIVSRVPNSTLNANSILRNSKDSGAIDIGIRRQAKLGLMGRISFRRYFQRRYGIQVRHAREKLLSVHEVKRAADSNPFLGVRDEGGDDQHVIYLIPELVQIHPMPRDLLYLIGSAEYFMPALERQVSLQSFAQSLVNMAHEYPQCQQEKKVALGAKHSPQSPSRSFADLLAEATTLHPTNRYETLEFLGDRVLNCYVALNVFALNSSLRWDAEEVGEHAQSAFRNVALYDGSLRAGLSKMILPSLIRWKGKLEKTGNIYVDLAEGTLSDIVESVMAAAYLHDVSSEEVEERRGLTTIALLELLDLPLPDSDSHSCRPWFKGAGPCWLAGYPFERDAAWETKLHEVDHSLKAEEGIKIVLDERVNSLIATLASWTTEEPSITQAFSKEASKLLLQAALFDANLDGTDYDIEMDSTVAENLVPLALLRDNLFHVGRSALDLVVAEALHRLYPDASAGEHHLLLACAVTDDVIVYIMSKWNLHDFLFDQHATCREELRLAIEGADEIGKAWWDRNSGWLLPGGSELFQHRRRSAFYSQSLGDSNSLSDPMYPGLCGGRFFGRQKKLNARISADLQFSFMCIVGSLVLAVGRDAMWHTLRPLFAEVMLLSPSEYRQHFLEVSTLCQAYFPETPKS